MIVTREEHEASLAELAASIANPRAGILGPRSVAWRIGGDLSVFLGGGRAAFLQLAHPMVAHAIDHHSKTRSDVVGRFQRTFRHVFAMVFGELDDALVAARRVHAIHTRIAGSVPIAYHANDADALRWVHATLIDTTIVVREMLDGRPLSRGDRDGYVTEMNRFAALFGIPHAMRARSHAEHTAYFASTVGALDVAPVAREMGRFLIGRGGDTPQPLLGRLNEALAASMLPPRIVDAFGLRPSPIFALAAMNRLPRLVPIPAHAEARRRLAGRGPSATGAWIERRLFGLARQATGT